MEQIYQLKWALATTYRPTWAHAESKTTLCLLHLPLSAFSLPVPDILFSLASPRRITLPLKTAGEHSCRGLNRLR